MKFFEQPDSDENFKININTLFSTTRKNLPPVESMIDSKQRKIFIKKLFANQETDYQRLIQKLEPLGSWQEAYKMVEEELLNRKINVTKKEEAILFTNILFRRYFP